MMALDSTSHTVSQTPLNLKSDLKHATGSAIDIDRHWVTLGPFPTGMREQDFGADPLEAYAKGGFRSLEYDSEAWYPSELARFGSVTWNSTKQDDEGWVHVIYPDVEWKFNGMFMGWSFNQYQAWARSSFVVSSSSTQSNDLVPVTIQCTNVGDFYVDDERLSGDWYGYGLTRHVLRLAPGSHTLAVRVAHEVRIFGGVILPPPSKFRCDLEVVVSETEGEAHVQVVREGHGGVILMDVVDGVVAGEFISVALRNVGTESVRITRVKVVQGSERVVAQLRDPELIISPTVHRPLAIQLALKDDVDLGERLEFSLEFSFEIGHGNHRKASVRSDVFELAQKKWGEIYKYTFTDFDGTVHYAATFPPSRPEAISTSAPILVALHGAGREVENSAFWLQEYQQRENTWIVLPTGRSPWGYDWHGASIKNVMNALEALARDLPGVPAELRGLAGIRPDPERLFIAGHSNGGQGAWFLTTHYPDKAIAATPAAGYVNIKQYAPYSNWVSNSYTDSYLQGILGSAIAEFDNDVHMSNTVGIPILARAGSADDNVPPFSSRKMVRLGQENAHNRSAVRLSEIAGEGHWFTGILHGTIMQEFLRKHLNDDLASSGSNDLSPREVGACPPFPSYFEITTINPGGMGSKGGIQIEQLQIPFRKGTIKVKIQNNHRTASSVWNMHTTNIRRFGFAGASSLVQRRGQIDQVVIDGDIFKLDEGGETIGGVMLTDGVFVKNHGNKGSRKWTLSTSNQWLETERHRETYGPAIQVLEKKLVIVIGNGFEDYPPADQRTAQRVARLVAHDVYQYGRGDVEIVTDTEYFERSLDKEEGDQKRNLVLVGDAHQNKVTNLVLSQTRSEVTMHSRLGVVSVHPEASAFEIEGRDFKEPGTGLLMTRPWGSRNLAVIIAGIDAQGLETAARLFPKRTGLLVPDWIVTGPEMPWKGAGGILAAG
ncbi:hypothetical protein MVEG_12241 [Podila verticillata NRRL 6337]|uniref:Peptidase S9 prolyl oligopeptidase catalytic domain-containing protein n=1 Tax=Podila verticillata NRRL 6337 TaxID=1069443 RepID=A0A086TIY0_9FUNG|nr:hypothetical protein MVEG_12241 [Podila verticillata NRRL 6337]